MDKILIVKKKITWRHVMYVLNVYLLYYHNNNTESRASHLLIIIIIIIINGGADIQIKKYK